MKKDYTVEVILPKSALKEKEDCPYWVFVDMSSEYFRDGTYKAVFPQMEEIQKQIDEYLNEYFAEYDTWRKTKRKEMTANDKS